MAMIPRQPKKMPTSITRFLGLNQDTTGDTQLKLGETPDMTNIRITENYKLRKREGYRAVFATMGVGKVVWKMWYGKVAGTFRFVFACNGKLWSHNRVTGANTEIGTVSDVRVCMFGFSGKLYVADGVDYFCWDGTTFSPVVGYRPLIAVATPPAGGGTTLETLNMLTGAKRQWFSGNGTDTAFFVRETAIGSIDWVKLNGVLLTPTTHYTVDLALGKVTFVTAPATGTVNNVEIAWTKGTGERGAIARLVWSTAYGPANNTRVFGWGDSQNPSTLRYTGLADGVPSAEYWPSTGYIMADAGQTITDCVRQQSALNIYTDSDAKIASSEIMTDALGRSVATFPTNPLHGAIGCSAPGQAQLVENQPVTVTTSGVYAWALTGIADERNAKHISKKVQTSLDTVDLSSAITVDWDTRGELWICVGSDVWIFNYRLGVWYMFTNIPATCFMVIDGQLYFGTADGQIMLFDTDIHGDNGQPITAHWETGFYDFSTETLMKFITRLWISIQPETKASVDISYITNRGAGAQSHTARYSLATFEHADFGKWSFLTSYNPQPFRFKIKAKKFVFFKLMLDSNNADEAFTVLSISFADRTGGESK